MDYNFKSITTISRKMRALYVEDNKEARSQTIKMLENFFTDVSVASDGEEGLEVFESTSFDIVFTDIEMPVMGGITMIEKIREIDQEVSIVVFSAYDKSEYFLKTISAGIDGYLLKPYDFDQIMTLISKIVHKFDIKNKIKLVESFLWDKETKELIKDDKKIKLTKNEIKLLDILASSQKRIMSNEYIEECIFEDGIVDNKRVRNLISRLKTKLGTSLIESNYGNGYQLKTSETI